MIDKFLSTYKEILHVLAEVTVHTLEIIGISIIIVGAIRVLIRIIKSLYNKKTEPQNAVIALGRTLALALEFKMGAEIVNTVIVRDLSELAVLGIIIGLRAVLAVLIHWEITTEEKEEAAHAILRERAIKSNQESEESDEDKKQD